jgi:hypothetical protein
MDSASDVTQVTAAQRDLLDEYAERIRAYAKRTVADLIGIGEYLVKAKEQCSHGDWLAWLDREFKWSDRHALNLMRLYELSLSNPKHVSDLNIPVAGLYLLAAPSTPPEAVIPSPPRRKPASG